MYVDSLIFVGSLEHWQCHFLYDWINVSGIPFDPVKSVEREYNPNPKSYDTHLVIIYYIDL